MVKIQANTQGKAYYTSAGKVLLAQEGGSTPNIESLNVTPTTSAQTITASGDVDGYSPVNVSAVTSSIDSNISAGNIKKDVTILGVTGTYEGGGSGGYSEIPSYQVSNGVVSRRSGTLTTANFSNITRINTNGFNYAFFNCQNLTGNLNLSSLTTIKDNGLYYAFYQCIGLTSVDLSSLKTVSGSNGLQYAFYNCNSLTSVDLSSLTTVSGTNGLQYAFQDCRRLTNIDLSSLTTVSGTNGLAYAFQECRGLTSVDLSSLKTVSGSSGLQYVFFNCNSLMSVDLLSLDSINYNALKSAFAGCTALTDIYFRALTTSSFGSYTNQFNNMIGSTGTTTTHTLHFPSNLESTISGLTGYPLFGGTSGYVVLSFDLPATS